MGTVYIAHRLFALHDRILAAELAALLSEENRQIPLFLPYCDTKEDTIVIDKKGYYLFERDVERMKGLGVLVAILHGPSYDDGVCLEIGFAYSMGIPIVLLTTDFITYSFANDQQRFIFNDPLLGILGSRVIHVTDPYPDDATLPGNHYVRFRQRNVRSLEDALRKTCGEVLDALSRKSNSGIVPVEMQKLVYIEPSPYSTSTYLDGIRASIEQMGWDCYVANRLRHSAEPVEERARRDLQKALQSNILVLDGNGPEVPPGAALLTGISLALGKTTLLYYMGTQTTHAHGREENARNLMLLYGCSSMVQTLEELEKCLLMELLLRE